MHEKAILIASDFYGRSDLALHRGLVLAAEQGLDVKLMSIVSESIPGEFAHALVKNTREHLESVAFFLGKRVKSEITVETGDPVTRCLELMCSADIGLVVVGQHHKRGYLDNLKVPTVFWSIASESQSPVLLVAKPVHGPYRRVLVPTAFSLACQRAALSARKLAPDAEFRIFHVGAFADQGVPAIGGELCEPSLQQDEVTQMMRWKDNLPSELSEVDFVSDRVGPGVQGMIDEFKPDLLAIGARKCDVSRTGLGLYASKLIRDPPTDLLICRGSPDS